MRCRVEGCQDPPHHPIRFREELRSCLLCSTHCWQQGTCLTPVVDMLLTENARLYNSFKDLDEKFKRLKEDQHDLEKLFEDKFSEPEMCEIRQSVFYHAEAKCACIDCSYESLRSRGHGNMMDPWDPDFCFACNYFKRTPQPPVLQWPKALWIASGIILATSVLLGIIYK